MKRIVRLTESDLTRIVRRVIMEQKPSTIGYAEFEKENNAVRFKLPDSSQTHMYSCDKKTVVDNNFQPNTSFRFFDTDKTAIPYLQSFCKK